jgi:hypothetical protein
MLHKKHAILFEIITKSKPKRLFRNNINYDNSQS